MQKWKINGVQAGVLFPPSLIPEFHGSCLSKKAKELSWAGGDSVVETALNFKELYLFFFFAGCVVHCLLFSPFISYSLPCVYSFAFANPLVAMQLYDAKNTSTVTLS